MKEIGERSARDRFDRIAEKQVAAVSVAPRLASHESNRLHVQARDGLLACDQRGDGREGRRGRVPIARKSRGVVEEVPQRDRLSSRVELHYVLLDGIVE